MQNWGMSVEFLHTLIECPQKGQGIAFCMYHTSQTHNTNNQSVCDRRLASPEADAGVDIKP